MNKVEQFDTVVAQAVGKIPKFMHTPFHLLGYASMPIVWVVIILALIIGNPSLSQPMVSHLIVLAFLPLANILKMFIRRSRPKTIYAEAMKIKSYSFPSGHSYTAALAAGYLAALMTAAGMPALAALLIALVFLIGLSRVHIGAHYPSDVVAGWSLGALIVVITLALT